MKTYLGGIEWDPFEGIPDIYVTGHHIRGWRYFASYANGQSGKPAIFKKLAEQGMHEIPGDWDWHHVVEGNHLEPLFSPIEYRQLYSHEWPTVLIHSKEEHKVLNSLFRSAGTDAGLTKNPLASPISGMERERYLRTLDQRYQDIYLGDPVLRKIAHNVISRLR